MRFEILIGCFLMKKTFQELIKCVCMHKTKYNTVKDETVKH